jgi:hypothetical protein
LNICSEIRDNLAFGRFDTTNNGRDHSIPDVAAINDCSPFSLSRSVISVRLLDVFGARACAAEFVSTVGVGCPGLLVVAGVLLIVRVLDGAFRVWLLHADLSYGEKGERLSPALVQPDGRWTAIGLRHAASGHLVALPSQPVL